VAHTMSFFPSFPPLEIRLTFFHLSVKVHS
jgi:hypothetical protein